VIGDINKISNSNRFTDMEGGFSFQWLHGESHIQAKETANI